MTEYNKVMEWDRPNVGLYSDGSIRIITSRATNGAVGACHMASPEEIRWVLSMEKESKSATQYFVELMKEVPPKQVVWKTMSGDLTAQDIIDSLEKKTDNNDGRIFISNIMRVARDILIRENDPD